MAERQGWSPTATAIYTRSEIFQQADASLARLIARTDFAKAKWFSSLLEIENQWRRVVDDVRTLIQEHHTEFNVFAKNVLQRGLIETV